MGTRRISEYLHVTPCKMCGVLDRYASGACKPCHRAADARYRAKQIAEDLPCSKCGSRDRLPSGRCKPCGRRYKTDAYARDPSKVLNAQRRKMESPVYRANHNANKRALRASDPERCRMYDSNWLTANLERHMLIRTKAGAKKRGLDFNLELSDIVIPTHCPVFGIPLERVSYGERGKRSPATPSLDRIDSSKGYVKGNVWVISDRANRIKYNATLEELKAVVAGVERMLANGPSVPDTVATLAVATEPAPKKRKVAAYTPRHVVDNGWLL